MKPNLREFKRLYASRNRLENIRYINALVEELEQRNNHPLKYPTIKAWNGKMYIKIDEILGEGENNK